MSKTTKTAPKPKATNRATLPPLALYALAQATTGWDQPPMEKIWQQVPKLIDTIQRDELHLIGKNNIGVDDIITAAFPDFFSDWKPEDKARLDTLLEAGRFWPEELLPQFRHTHGTHGFLVGLAVAFAAMQEHQIGGAR